MSYLVPLHSLGISGHCGVGGGSVWLCWEVRRRPVLWTGRPNPDHPAYQRGVELWQAQRQRGHVPKGFCWEQRWYEVLTVLLKWWNYCPLQSSLLSALVPVCLSCHWTHHQSQLRQIIRWHINETVLCFFKNLNYIKVKYCWHYSYNLLFIIDQSSDPFHNWCGLYNVKTWWKK